MKILFLCATNAILTEKGFFAKFGASIRIPKIKEELSKHISESLPPPVSSYPTINNPKPIQSTKRQPSKKKKYLFEQVHKLYEKEYSKREIARHLHLSRVTVRKYLSMNEPQVQKMTFRNNYSRFLPIVQNGIHNKARINEIYRNAVTDGLTCPYVSFLHWMRTVFPEYKTFKGRATRNSRVDSTGYDKTKSVFKSLYSHKLNIYVANPEWGINKKTGECSEENIQMNKIIKLSDTLLKLRKFCVSFKSVIAGKSTSDLITWIEKYKTETLSPLRTFVRGLLRDIDAVKNSILSLQ